jgi:hypothetical protein
MYLMRLLWVMTFVKCVQSSELPVNEMTSEAEEPTQPADEIGIKLNPGGTSEDLDRILKRHYMTTHCLCTPKSHTVLHDRSLSLFPKTNTIIHDHSLSLYP